MVGEHREHDRLRGADRRRADGLAARRRMEQIADHRDDAPVDRIRLGILVLVDQVLGLRLDAELVGLRLHPCRDERGEVEHGVAVEGEIVVHELVRRLGVESRVGQAELRDSVAERPCRVGGREGGVGVERQLLHGVSPRMSMAGGASASR
jgi:hypothetical protein